MLETDEASHPSKSLFELEIQRFLTSPWWTALQASNFDESDTVENIVYYDKDKTKNHKKHPIIKSASLPKLIQKLTPDDPLQRDDEYIRDFILGYRTFLTPLQFVHLLCLRYSKTDKESVLQSVIYITEKWTSVHPNDFTEDNRILTFVLHKLFETTAQKSKSSSAKLSEVIKKASQLPFKPKPLHDIIDRSGKGRLNFTDANTKKLAQQLSLFDHEMFSALQSREFFGQSWRKPTREQDSPNVLRIINTFNRMIGWYGGLIVREPSAEKRTAVMTKLISLAKALKRLNNYNGLMAVLSAINQTPIYRLKTSLGGLSKKPSETLTLLNNLMGNLKNYKEYRDALRHSKPPIIPYLGVFLSDMTYSAEVMTYIDGLLNFDKARQMGTSIQSFLSLLRGEYKTPRDENVLKCLPPVDTWDEHELYRMSRILEPSGKTKGGTAPTQSPTSVQTISDGSTDRIIIDEITKPNEADWRKLLSVALEMNFTPSEVMVQQGYRFTYLYKIKKGGLNIQRTIKKKGFQTVRKTRRRPVQKQNFGLEDQSSSSLYKGIKIEAAPSEAISGATPSSPQDVRNRVTKQLSPKMEGLQKDRHLRRDVSGLRIDRQRSRAKLSSIVQDDKNSTPLPLAVSPRASLPKQNQKADEVEDEDCNNEDDEEDDDYDEDYDENDANALLFGEEDDPDISDNMGFSPSPSCEVKVSKPLPLSNDSPTLITRQVSIIATSSPTTSSSSLPISLSTSSLKPTSNDTLPLSHSPVSALDLILNNYTAHCNHQSSPTKRISDEFEEVEEEEVEEVEVDHVQLMTSQGDGAVLGELSVLSSAVNDLLNIPSVSDVNVVASYPLVVSAVPASSLVKILSTDGGLATRFFFSMACRLHELFHETSLKPLEVIPNAPIINRANINSKTGQSQQQAQAQAQAHALARSRSMERLSQHFEGLADLKLSLGYTQENNPLSGGQAHTYAHGSSGSFISARTVASQLVAQSLSTLNSSPSLIPDKHAQQLQSQSHSQVKGFLENNSSSKSNPSVKSYSSRTESLSHNRLATLLILPNSPLHLNADQPVSQTLSQSQQSLSRELHPRFGLSGETLERELPTTILETSAGILVEGRGYVTRHHLCFSGKWYGCRVTKVYEWTKVTRLIPFESDNKIDAVISSGHSMWTIISMICTDEKLFSEILTILTALHSARRPSLQQLNIEETELVKIEEDSLERWLLDKEEWELILQGAKVVQYDPGQSIVKQADRHNPRRLYVILSGTCLMIHYPNIINELPLHEIPVPPRHSPLSPNLGIEGEVTSTDSQQEPPGNQTIIDDREGGSIQRIKKIIEDKIQNARPLNVRSPPIRSVSASSNYLIDSGEVGPGSPGFGASPILGVGSPGCPPSRRYPLLHSLTTQSCSSSPSVSGLAPITSSLPSSVSTPVSPSGSLGQAPAPVPSSGLPSQDNLLSFSGSGSSISAVSEDGSHLVTSEHQNMTNSGSGSGRLLSPLPSSSLGFSTATATQDRNGFVMRLKEGEIFGEECLMGRDRVPSAWIVAEGPQPVKLQIIEHYFLEALFAVRPNLSPRFFVQLSCQLSHRLKRKRVLLAPS